MKWILSTALLLGACAQQPVAEPQQSVVPGTIGVSVRQDHARVVIAAVSMGNPLRVGDVVLRYNGETVTSARQFYRLVVDSAPGSVASVEVMREGATRAIDVPVVELDTVPRA
jgi:S1-C subfamily serine protease